MINRYKIGIDEPEHLEVFITDTVAQQVIAYSHRRDLDNVRELVRRANAAGDLLELLTLALPYVEEGEQFNKPSCRDLSKKIRAAIAKAEGGAT